MSTPALFSSWLSAICPFRRDSSRFRPDQIHTGLALPLGILQSNLDRVDRRIHEAFKLCDSLIPGLGALTRLGGHEDQLIVRGKGPVGLIQGIRGSLEEIGAGFLVLLSAANPGVYLEGQAVDQ